MNRFSLLRSSAFGAFMCLVFLMPQSCLAKMPSLVDASWLADRANDKDLLILEISNSKDSFAKAHIPGAIFLHWVEDVSSGLGAGQYNVLDAEAMQRLMRQIGATRRSQIVVYDDMGSRCAVRMFWMLRYYGHIDVAVLNGGKLAWPGSGRPFSDNVQVVKRSGYIVAEPDAKLIVDRSGILEAMSEGKVSLIDGRSAAQFQGEEPGRVYHTGKAHRRQGHIEGAVNIFWGDNFTSDGKFKSVNELKSLYQRHGIDGRSPVITYCNEGLHAAPPWFVLHELLGYDNVRLYDHSMAEWANSDETAMSSNEE